MDHHALSSNPRSLWNSIDGAVLKASVGPVAAPLTVEAFDNHVYFYSDVDTDRCLALVKTLRELDNKFRQESSSRNMSGTIVPIWLHINSGGGDMFSAFGVADQIRQIQTPIISIIEGLTASAATIISTACPKRLVQPSAYMLIHQFSAFFWGKHEEFKDEMQLQEMMMKRIIAFYVSRTKLDEVRLAEMLKHDTWMDAAKAIEYGFADAECTDNFALDAIGKR
jgi:ATP-dependent protease ClpP protease subunit